MNTLSYLEQNLWAIWLLMGIVFCVMEIFVPGTVIIWWGVASLLTSAAVYYFHLSPLASTAICTALALACLVAWFGWFRHRFVTLTGQAEEYRQAVGEITSQITSTRYNAIFDLPVLGDRVWAVESPDALQKGDRIKIDKVYGQILKVRKIKEGGEKCPQ